MLTLEKIMAKAKEIYKDNPAGMIIFQSFALGIMRSRMDREDLKLMDEYLYTRQFKGAPAQMLP